MNDITTTATPALVDLAAQWRQAAADWLLNYQSPHTRRVYASAWRQFLASVDVDVSEVQRRHVLAYRDELAARGLSPATVNLRLSAISSFYDYAVKVGLRTDNPVTGIQRPPVDAYGNATWLEAGQDVALVASIATDSEIGLRDRAIILLLLVRGFRVAEVASLRIDALQRSGRRASVTYKRKGGKVRTVTLPAVAADAIDAYLSSRGNPGAGPLFVATEAGREAAAYLGHEVSAADALSVRAIHAMIRSRCNAVFGRGHGISPHSLRHTAATMADAAGVSIGGISDLLGHASPGITSRYLHAVSGAGDAAADVLAVRYT